MISLARQTRRLALLYVVLLVVLIACLSACSVGSTTDKTLTLATIFPTTGTSAAIGQAMQRGVDLAVQQNASPGNGYKLTVTHIDEASDAADKAITSAIANKEVMGIVGPLGSQTATTMLPAVTQNGIATISPGAALPGLTQADQAAAEGISFARLHPKGSAVAFFRLAATDNALGKAAADLAVAPQQAHGLAAQSVFVVDDSTPSGKALAAAFSQEFKAKQGHIAGQTSIMTGAQGNAQAVVTAIIEADPSIVFFADDSASAAGARLRSMLSLSGAPQLPILTVGLVAYDPGWSAAVGVVPAAAYTTALVPAADLSTISNAKAFVAAYQAAYPGKDVLPQSALAYDAAMDQIAAIKSLIKANKTVTRPAMLAAVASAKYSGVTGTIAFDKNGDSMMPVGLSLYTCDIKGAWHYQTSLSAQ